MEKRRILLEDGRYLIFYTFEDSVPPPEVKFPEQEQESPRPEGDRHE